MFVLTANDDDSILAGKILISMGRAADGGVVPHRSPGYGNDDINPGARVFFIRPYLKIAAFTGMDGYAYKNNCILFDFDNSELYEHAGELREAGVECHWVDSKSTLSEYVWGYQHPDTDPPKIVKWTRDYMKWELNYPESSYLHLCLSILGNRRLPNISQLYTRLLGEDDDDLSNMLRDGQDIQEHITAYYKALSDELVFCGTIGEHKCLVANASGVSSLFFSDNRSDYTAYDLMVIFHHDFSRNNVRHTLYQIDPELSMRDIAKAFGNGGGHDGVAGFTSGILQVVPEFCKLDKVDYNNILGPSELPEHIISYIDNVLCIARYGAKAMVYEGIECLVANTPHLTHMPIFKHVMATREHVGLTICMRRDGSYRVAATSLDKGVMDPGERFGELVGPYRISIKTAEELQASLGGKVVIPR